MGSCWSEGDGDKRMVMGAWYKAGRFRLTGPSDTIHKHVYMVCTPGEP